MGYLSLSFDHRVIDGATADQFMAKIKGFLEESHWNKSCDREDVRRQARVVQRRSCRE